MPEEEQATELKSKQEESAEPEGGQEQATAVKNTVTIEQVGPCKKKVIIEIPQEAIQNATDKQYEELRKEALVPGFRKGRAPRRLLEKRYGKETSEQIKLKLLLDASDSAVKQNKLQTIGEPDIDLEKRFLFSVELEFQDDLDNRIISEELRQEFENNEVPLSKHATISVEQQGSSWLVADDLKKYPIGKQEPKLNIYETMELPESGPLRFEFEVEVRPDIDLPPLEGIPLTRTKLEVTDDQIDRETERLQRWSGVWALREKGAVELDDQIIADVILKVDGTGEQDKPENEDQPDNEDKLDDIEIYVRQNGFVGVIPVENLDKLLVGAKVGDVKQTSVEVPKTYFREEYRGKKMHIQITIKDIKWLKPAELDKNFLKRSGAEDENDLREKVRDTLQSRLEQDVRTEMTEQIYEYLLDNTDFDLPLDIVAEHSMTLLKRHYSNLMMRGLPRERIEEQIEQLQASSEQQAKEQFKTFFVMDKVAEDLKIEVSEEEINGRIAQLAIQQRRRPERMRDEMERDGSLAQFTLQVRENKCIAKLLESAKITEKKAPRKSIKKRLKKSAKGKR